MQLNSMFVIGGSIAAVLYVLIPVALHCDKYVQTKNSAFYKKLFITLKMEERMNEETKQCPYCAETIKVEAVTCKFCERDLTEPVKVGEIEKEEEKRSNAARTLILLGGLALIVGAFLPWASISAPFVGSLSLSGYQGDGIISGAIGLILFVVALISRKGPGKIAALLTLLLGVLAGMIVIPKLFDFAGISADYEVSLISVGSGIYVSIIGALLVVIGAIRGLFS